MTIRTRFSPSPTGIIHLGNARTALFSALFAAKHQGTFILRIEDTDVVRSEERFADILQRDLNWLGIYWQEGPGMAGDYGPYWQSQRHEIYAQFYKKLDALNYMYPCFCSDQELMLARKVQLSRGQAPRYAGTCLKLSASDIEKRIAAGEKPAWRFKVPRDKAITFTDLVKGQQVFQTNDIGDFIIRRADSTAPFLFCNAIDDATMKVSHVLRGEDHLANTPRQLMILEALSLQKPHYGHLSLIVGDDNAPLSKRHGSYSLQDMREKGYLPLALLNYLGRLGHSCDAQQLLDFAHLAVAFQEDKLSKSASRFDLIQLLHWQKLSVQALNEEEFWRWLGPTITSQIPEVEKANFAATVKTNIEFPHDATTWIKIFFHEGTPIEPENISILKEAGEQFFVTAEQAVQKYGIDLDKVLAEMKTVLAIGGKKLFMPLRVALTGKTHGPELAPIAAILGKEKILHRLSHAYKLTVNGGA